MSLSPRHYHLYQFYDEFDCVAPVEDVTARMSKLYRDIPDYRLAVLIVSIERSMFGFMLHNKTDRFDKEAYLASMPDFEGNSLIAALLQRYNYARVASWQSAARTDSGSSWLPWLSTHEGSDASQV